MNVAVAAAVFPVILVAELPDKTLLAVLVMATRGRAGLVWLGAAAAFTVHVVLATTAGLLAFRLLPHRVVEAAVAAMFLAGAMFAAREARRDRQAGRAAAGPPPLYRRHRALTTAFVVIFAAEWGDLTQILTVNLTAHYHAPLAVGLGALLALWSIAAIAVAGGQRLSRVASAVAIRAGTAVLLTGLAVYTGWAALA